MAFHAIKAGEGDVFISAGVEMVSRFVNGLVRLAGPTPTTRSSPTPRPAPPRPRAVAPTWHDPRHDNTLPDIYIPMGQTAENLAQVKQVSREDMDHFGVRSQNLAEKAIKDGFWAREISPVDVA